jgi:hypothetical protein
MSTDEPLFTVMVNHQDQYSSWFGHCPSASCSTNSTYTDLTDIVAKNRPDPVGGSAD